MKLIVRLKGEEWDEQFRLAVREVAFLYGHTVHHGAKGAGRVKLSDGSGNASLSPG